MSEVKFVDGLFVEKPKEGVPEFVKCKLSFNVAKIIAFLESNKNEKGYVNVDILESKEKGSYYAKFNDFKPNTQNSQENTSEASSEAVEEPKMTATQKKVSDSDKFGSKEEIKVEDIPF